MEKEREFDIYSYDGEYPRNMDGTLIRTYKPKIIGGEIEAKFNGHTWDHSPYLQIHTVVWDDDTTNGVNPELGVTIWSLLTTDIPNPCVLESFYFHIPMKVGIVNMNESIGLQYESASFTIINCDAGKDKYKLDKGKNNTVNVTSYNPDTRELRAEFDVSFVIKDRNSDFGPIYPEHVRIQGKIKTVVMKE